MKYMAWVWPISWRIRIFELDAEVQRLRAENLKLKNDLRGAYLQQTAMTITYTSAVSAISAQFQSFLAQR